MDVLVVNNAYPLVCVFRLIINVRDPDPRQKIVPKRMVIYRNRGLKVVEERGKKDFATKCMSGIDKAGQ